MVSRFNRTFMELKLNITSRSLVCSRVLIVPLWNWNVIGSFSCDYAQGFNRTFMELKYYWHTYFAKGLNVLIVPLWNWNKDIMTPVRPNNGRFNRTFMELK